MDTLNNAGASLPVVLVAEDDQSNFKLINAIIGKKCQIIWAHDGQEAVDLYRAHKADIRLILMDIKMPRMTGLEATESIRGEDKEVPIVMQTAYAFASDRENALRAGANDVLVKPITLILLRQAVSRYIPEVKW